jgi:putative DNA primase/helicase
MKSASFSPGRGSCAVESTKKQNSRGKRAKNPHQFDAALRDARKCIDAKTVTAIVNLARADRRHVTVADDWDSDPWKLNTPAGTVDLRTGDVLPHNINDMITKIITASPTGECPLWHKFLDFVTDGDIALKRYVQRMVGYSLTGVTVEEHLLSLRHRGKR